MGGIRLAVQALLWRKGLAVALVLVASLTTTAAVLSPTYARSGQEVMLRDTKAQLPISIASIRMSISYGFDPFSTGNEKTFPVAGLAETGAKYLRGFGLDEFYAKPVLGMESHPRSISVRSRAGGGEFASTIVWREGFCAHLRFTTGRCPKKAKEIAVSAADVKRWGIDTKSGLQDNDGFLGRGVEIVGTYEPIRPDDPYWAGAGYFVERIQVDPMGRPVLPPMRAVFLAQPGAEQVKRFEAFAERVLRKDTLTMESLPRLTTALTTAQSPRGLERVDGDPLEWSVKTAMDAPLADLVKQLDVVAQASLLVLLQLLLLGWYVFYLLVSASSEHRQQEFALAKLRGHRLGSTLAFGVTQPAIVLLMAVPLGLLGGWAGVLALRGPLLKSDVPVVMPTSVWLTLGAALAGGLIATALACWGLVSQNVSTQLRNSPAGAGRRVAGLVVSAALVALAMAGIYELVTLGRKAQTSGLAMLTPGLIALATGVVGAQLVLLIAALWTRYSARRSGLGGFIAARQLVRRRGNARVIVLLVTAAALVLFATDAWWAAGDFRESTAAYQVGAFTNRTVIDTPVNGRGTMSTLQAAVRKADPSGKRAMAVAVLTPVGARPVQRIVAVDATRFGAIGAWHPSWGKSAGEVAAKLRPRSAAKPVAGRGPAALGRSVVLRGKVIGLEVRTDSLEAKTAVSMEMELADNSGRLHTWTPGDGMGPATRLRRGTATYTGEVSACANGCTLRSIHVYHGAPDDIAGRLVVQQITADGRPVDAGFDDAEKRWRPMLALEGQGFEPPGINVTRSADGMQLDIDSYSPAQPLRVTTTDVPAVAPMVLGRAVRFEVHEDAGKFVAYARRGLDPDTVMDADGLDGQLRPYSLAGRVASLPIVGQAGILVDYETMMREMNEAMPSLQLQVWFAQGASPAMVKSIERAGFVFGETTTLTRARDILDRSGSAVALSVFLITAIGAFVLALAGTVMLLLISARRRAYEVAALEVIGVPRRILRRAETVESLGLLGAAIVIALGCATLSLRFVPQSIPVLADTSTAPPMVVGAYWGLILSLVAGMTVVLGTFGWLVVSAQVARTRPEILREARP